MKFLIYGASGYTGKLIVELACSKGLKPVLAGRSDDKIKPLAQDFGLEYQVFSLDDVEQIADHLKEFSLVINCAGPFIHTAKKMVEACIISKTHYLDITGEIDVFELVKSYDQAAKNASIVLMSGTGFDVVPTDCAAKYLHTKLPDATHLQLAFTSIGGSISHGTLLTMIENLGQSGAVRKNGKIISKPVGHISKNIDFGSKQRFCMSIPWGDVSTAHHTTGIPNIETYTAVSKSSYYFMKFQWLFNSLLRTNFVKKRLKNYADKKVIGPTSLQNSTGKSLVWGMASNASGDTVEVRIEGPEGYKLTAETSVLIIQKILAEPNISGYQTPAGLFGYDLILQIPGTKMY